MTNSTLEPGISDRFDVDDIRKIREYNSLRHINMSRSEIVEEIRKNTENVIDRLGLKRKTINA